MKTVKDNFSQQASAYSKFRPDYPGNLYEFVLSHCQGRENVLDCATGNGQVARHLSPHFSQVYATDISQKQLEHAYQAPNIRYSLQRAETTHFESGLFDLITVGQAYHWFDFEAFGREANRLLKSDGIIAIWSYHLPQFGKTIDEHLQHFYKDIVGPYWDKERKWVDHYYRDVPFPFEEIATDFSFEIKRSFSLSDFEGYLNTWSAVRHFIAQEGHNPANDLIRQVKPLWTSLTCDAVFPGFVNLGRKLSQIQPVS